MKKEYLESLLEDVKEKFELVVEGQQGLQREIKEMRQEMNERFEVVDFKIETLNQKIDGFEAKLTGKIDGVEAKLTKKIDGFEAKLSKKIDGVAADLSAHRADTESHPKGYRASDS
jgi:chromosome segregation ATPase